VARYPLSYQAVQRSQSSLQTHTCTFDTMLNLQPYPPLTPSLVYSPSPSHVQIPHRSHTSPKSCKPPSSYLINPIPNPPARKNPLPSPQIPTSTFLLPSISRKSISSSVQCVYPTHPRHPLPSPRKYPPMKSESHANETNSRWSIRFDSSLVETERDRRSRTRVAGRRRICKGILGCVPGEGVQWSGGGGL